MQLLPILYFITATCAWPTVSEDSFAELQSSLSDYNAGQSSAYLGDVSSTDYTVFSVYDAGTEVGTSIYEVEPIDEITLYGHFTKDDLAKAIPSGKYSVKASSVNGQNTLLASACCTITACGIFITAHIGTI